MGIHRSEVQLIRIVGAAGQALVDVIEGPLECEISLPKAEVSASSTRLQELARHMLGPLAGKDKLVVKSLGVDYAAGRRRRTWQRVSTRGKRFDCMKLRL